MDHINNADKVGVVHCWEATKPLRAWEPVVQVEAVTRCKELFPNMPAPDVSSTQQVAALVEGAEQAAPGEEDPEALYGGVRLFWRAAMRRGGSSGF